VPRISSASSFLPASALFFPPQPLAELRWTRRAMRPTNFCHLNDLRAPVLRAFSIHSAAFTAWTSHEVLGFVRLDRGTECFTALANASADRELDTRCLLLPPALTYPCPGMRTRAWALSSHGACSDQASDTSVATPSSAALAEPSPYLPALVVSSFRSCRVRAFVRVRRPPRSP